MKDYSLCKKVKITVDLSDEKGDFRGYMHALGHGGINAYPLPPRVVNGLKKLKPRYIRTFIQEYFRLYRGEGRYDFSLLDPYMRSLAETGAKIVACICFKPPELFGGAIDQRKVIPDDVAGWQALVEAVVRRYSVESELVTHWEIGNETDIGENGGCPYLTENAGEYSRFYEITANAVLKAFPAAKIGGPAVADGKSPVAEELLAFCKRSGRAPDFISWHKYSDIPEEHLELIDYNRKLLQKYFPEKRIEMFVTEMNKGYEKESVEEAAYDPARAACLGASLIEMLREKDVYTFFYHVWDQFVVNGQFDPFYGDPYVMQRYWNEVPIRFGMFGVCGEARPFYFLYAFLAAMRGKETACRLSDAALKAAAAKDGDDFTLLLVNHGAAEDVVGEVHFENFTDGCYELSVYRLDKDGGADFERLRAEPRERRYADFRGKCFFNVFCPAESVALIVMKKTTAEEIGRAYAAMQ